MTGGVCRHDEVVAELRRSLRERGRMPMTKELCADLGMKRGTLGRIIPRLAELGRITLNPIGTLRIALPGEDTNG